MKVLAPRVVNDLLLIPRVNYWPEHGWRAEVLINDGAMGGIVVGEFVATRAEAEREVARDMLKAAVRYVDAAA